LDAKNFTQPAGRIVLTPGAYEAFVPDPLPRSLDLKGDLIYSLSEADRSLGELAGMARMLPNAQLLVAPLSQREAVLSSRIEGTQASISDLAIFEAAGETAPVRSGDVQEVLNYRNAMNYGLKRLETLPLSLRFVRELHSRLMTGVRGQERTPGEFRTSQNWIGTPGCSLQDATYVPPPPSEMRDCLSDWEAFLHQELKLPPLIKCALMHYQFEAIHPFLDGNGRIGRLLLVLFLCTMGHLPAPVLYLSPFFERHRDVYYERLQGISERGSWSSWLEFFIEGVIVQCRDAVVRSERMLRLHDEYRQRLLKANAPPAAHKVLEALFVSPATTAAQAGQRLKISPMTVSRALTALAGEGIIEEITGRRRDRVYVAMGIIGAIEDDSGVEDTFVNQPTLFE
jgi:Fic family protein